MLCPFKCLHRHKPLSFPNAALALGGDFYAKVVIMAYSHHVLGNLTPVVFSLHIYANCSVLLLCITNPVQVSI